MTAHRHRADAANDPLMSVTLHDVAPATQARCERLIARLQQVAPMALTLLVVPYYHGQRASANFEDWLDARLRRGDELALHGLTHLDDGAPPHGWLDHLRRRWYTDGEGEFAALGAADATRRLNAGRRWFARRRWPLTGFVAPAWLLGDGAWRALARQPFRYTCTRTELLLLPPSAPGQPPARVRARSIVYSTRAAWRRALSLPWNRLVAAAEQRAPWMRFELHPDDAEYDSVCSDALRLVERAFAQGRRPLTLAAVAERVRAAVLS
ncbi:MAG TPA: polysaccharide deacetylase family protein [Burkholderiaceae bacterium]|nr:polysaccharide deacetylase family protein [Burkholderiaceae bacterium]